MIYSAVTLLVYMAYPLHIVVLQYNDRKRVQETDRWHIHLHVMISPPDYHGSCFSRFIASISRVRPILTASEINTDRSRASTSSRDIVSAMLT